ncbi:MAG: AraC family transcriptional regulator [Clostridia bacterium]|nr:AraC family transcriptional regulator [Clostridia bacterium]
MTNSTEKISAEYIHLNSCGVQFLGDRDHCMIRSRGRVDYHILYIAEGCCYPEIFGKKAVASSGSLILFKPGERQKYEFLKSDCSVSCYIHFSGTGCEKFINEMGFGDGRIINIGRSRTILSIFEKMETESNLKRPCHESFCAAYLIELFAVICRKNIYAESEIYLKNKARIDAVCNLMYDEYYKNQPLRYYAEYCNLSESRFSHIFKASTGVTPLEYITKIRIDKAKELLSNYSFTVNEVAEKTGFSDQNYFSRIFKKHTGMPPKKYASSDIL